jgi:phage shock protein A
MSGIGEEMGDVGLAIQRAEDKTAQMQARAGAIDELIASGALEDASSLNQGDDIARELEAMSSQSEVEAELARLKGGSAPQAIEGGQDGGDILEAGPQAQSQAPSQSSGESAGEQK